MRIPKACVFVEKQETQRTMLHERPDRVLFYDPTRSSGIIEMALRDSTVEDGTLEECLDEINDFVQTLTRYPPRMIAVAMRAHLEILLRAMVECGMCKRDDILQFTRELQEEVLEENDA